MFKRDMPCDWRGCDRPQGVKGARGYCPAHYARMRYHEMTRGAWVPQEAWTRHGIPTADLLEEYDFLTGCLVPFREIATKLNINPSSLAQALTRAGRKVPTGVGAWRK